MSQRTLVRIAHAYGNRRRRLERALAADVDLIETDLRFAGDTVWVRHEHRLWKLPILFNHGLRGIHLDAPYSLTLGPLFVRLDRRPLTLPEVIARVAGRTGLLLDVKAERCSAADAARFADAVLAILDATRFAGPLDFCGSWPVLDLLRARRSDLTLHYSVDGEADWAALLPRARGGDAIRGITIQRRLLTGARGAFLREAGIDFYCWDVADAADADYAIALGTAGVIADDLALLRSLAGVSVRPEAAD